MPWDWAKIYSWWSGRCCPCMVDLVPLIRPLIRPLITGPPVGHRQPLVRAQPARDAAVEPDLPSRQPCAASPSHFRPLAGVGGEAPHHAAVVDRPDLPWDRCLPVYVRPVLPIRSGASRRPDLVRPSVPVEDGFVLADPVDACRPDARRSGGR
ncbi:hypothetical protein ACLOJK_002958 [Asimina triloba]